MSFFNIPDMRVSTFAGKFLCLLVWTRFPYINLSAKYVPKSTAKLPKLKIA
jgi:hypothetical protein